MRTKPTNQLSVRANGARIEVEPHEAERPPERAAPCAPKYEKNAASPDGETR
jgi:hypothetical protein